MEPSYSSAWFETFGKPEAEQTEREVSFLLAVLPSPPASVLDVPCGYGRHSHALVERGYEVVGVERNPIVGAEARAGGLVVYELDVRQLRELTGSFDAVICMWASLGWFDDETNADVLLQMVQKTNVGGVVVVDVYDPRWFARHQGTHELEREGRRVRALNAISGNRLRSSLRYDDGSQDEFEWRLYEPGELRAIAEKLGLALEATCADYDIETAPSGETARMQFVLRRI